MLNLVTGATGFIGTHIVQALIARGEEVRALVRPTSRTTRLRELGVQIRLGNLNDIATLTAAAQGAERIFHCAGLVGDWGVGQDFEQANVRGLRNMLAAATRARISRFIHLSTTDIYGFPGHTVDESDPPSPRGFPYADSKIQAENLLWTHFRRVRLPITVMRPASVYGPGATYLGSMLIDALRARRLFLIDEGRHIAGLTYVGNLVDAILLAIDNEKSIGQAYNITDGSDVTWGQYIQALATLAELPPPRRNYSHTRAYILATLWENYYRLLGRTERPPITRMMVELMGTDQSFSIEKARQELGYRPRVNFEEGIQHMGRWLHQERLLGLS